MGECENEHSHSQVSSHFGSWNLSGLSKFLESDCRGQNPSHWKVFYIIEKLLKRKCLKWAYMTHLDIWNTSYGQKKGRESNWQFPTIRSLESTRFSCVQVACNTSLKSFWWRPQLCFRPHLDQRSTHKVIAPQSCENPNFGNFGTPIWESRDKKAIWMWASQKGGD